MYWLSLVLMINTQGSISHWFLIIQIFFQPYLYSGCMNGENVNLKQPWHEKTKKTKITEKGVYLFFYYFSISSNKYAHFNVNLEHVIAPIKFSSSKSDNICQIINNVSNPSHCHPKKIPY